MKERCRNLIRMNWQRFWAEIGLALPVSLALRQEIRPDSDCRELSS